MKKKKKDDNHQVRSKFLYRRGNRVGFILVHVRREDVIKELIYSLLDTKLPFDLYDQTCSVSLLQRINRIGSNQGTRFSKMGH